MNVKGVQSFLGFANFYREFIEDFSNLSAPLSLLTHKKEPWKWGEEQEKAFRELKEKFITAPILTHWDPDLLMVLEADCSGYSLGACLSQVDREGRLQPVAYFSKKLSPAESNYPIYNNKMLAIVRAMEEWWGELKSVKDPFTVLTDYKNLIYFTTTKELNRQQVRWAETLATYNFTISYVKGPENARADALSRKPEYMRNSQPVSHAVLKQDGDSLVYNEMHLAATSIAIDNWANKLKAAYANIISQLAEVVKLGLSLTADKIVLC